LTHRDHHSSVTFLTGHPCEQNAAKGLNWAALAALPSLVIYMGVKNLPYIKEQLLTHGMAPDTPAALVRWGTVGQQQTLVGQLRDIDRKAQAARFHPPAIIVIGEVVRLREELNWHETKPLFGTTVACAAEVGHDSAPWTARLASCGADVVPVPLVPQPIPQEAAERFILALETCRWLVFGDRRQVDFFFHILKEHRWDVRRLTAQLAVFGQETAEALAQRGLPPARVLSADLPPEQVRRRLASSPGERVCLLQGGKTASLPGVNEVVLSLGRLSWDDAHPAARLLKAQRFDWLVAADPYHLDGLAEFAGKAWQDQPLLCLDGKTAQRAQEMGWKRVAAGIGSLSKAPAL
jgi:uroporphyrinogen III methyltransferase/synthase